MPKSGSGCPLADHMEIEKHFLFTISHLLCIKFFHYEFVSTQSSVFIITKCYKVLSYILNCSIISTMYNNVIVVLSF